MMTFRGNRLEKTRLPPGTVWLLEELAESKQKQALSQDRSIKNPTASGRRLFGLRFSLYPPFPRGQWPRIAPAYVADPLPSWT